MNARLHLWLAATALTIPLIASIDVRAGDQAAPARFVPVTLAGCTQMPQAKTVQARLTQNIPSVTGREDHAQVRLSCTHGVLHAEPVFGKSNLIYTLIRADGVVVVPLDQGGLYAGAEVPVQLYD